MERLFLKAADYSTYRLKNKSQRYNSKIASNITKLIKMLRWQLKETDFEEKISISILFVLKEFRDVCDSIGIHEKVATWLVFYFMKRQALPSLEALLSPRKVRLARPPDERLSRHFKVANYWLTTYETDDIIVQAIEESEFYMHAEKVSPAIYTDRL